MTRAQNEGGARQRWAGGKDTCVAQSHPLLEKTTLLSDWLLPQLELHLSLYLLPSPPPSNPGEQMSVFKFKASLPLMHFLSLLSSRSLWPIFIPLSLGSFRSADKVVSSPSLQKLSQFFPKPCGDLVATISSFSPSRSSHLRAWPILAVSVAHLLYTPNLASVPPTPWNVL